MSANTNADDSSTETQTDSDDARNTGNGRVHDWGDNGKMNRPIAEARDDDDRPGVIWNKKNSYGDETRIVLSSYEYGDDEADTLGKYAGLFIPETVTSAEATDGSVGEPQRVLEADIREDARAGMIDFIRNLSPEDLGYDGRADADDESDDDGGSQFPREAMRSRLAQRTKQHTNPDDADEKDLYTLAQEYGIKGRSTMTKSELVEAVLDAREEQFNSDDA